MQGTVVGVLRGGASKEHDVSIRSGHAIISSLPVERYTVRDIYIDRGGVWHERGRRTTPASVLPTVDVVVIALHGPFGSDGSIQRLLEKYGVPFTGSDSFASFESLHNVISKEKARALGIKIPRYVYIENEESIEPSVHEVIRTYPQPVIVKPSRGNSSTGVAAPTGYQPVHQAVTGLFAEGSDGAVIEEYLRGTEATVAVVEGIRGEELYVLPPVQITRGNKLSAPIKIPKAIADELEELARRMHQELRLSQYSSSDFVVSPKGIFYIQTNALPTLTADSVTPQALASVGIRFSDFLEHIIALALAQGRR